MIDRVVGLLWILAAVLAPVDYFAFVARPDVQMILGTVIVLYLVAVDVYAGLFFGIATLLMYLRVHAQKLGIPLSSLLIRNEKTESLSMPNGLPGNYITEQNLHDAQSNIVDPMAFTEEIKGVPKGPYGEPVYGAQGLDQEMPGYTIHDVADKFAPVQ